MFNIILQGNTNLKKIDVILHLLLHWWGYTSLCVCARACGVGDGR